MNPWSYQVSAQLVDRMQREGIEVVESPFEREWQLGRFGRLVRALWPARRDRGAQLDTPPRPNQGTLVDTKGGALGIAQQHKAYRVAADHFPDRFL